MGSCAAPSAKGDDKFITTDYLQQCLFFRLARASPHPTMPRRPGRARRAAASPLPTMAPGRRRWPPTSSSHRHIRRCAPASTIARSDDGGRPALDLASPFLAMRSTERPFRPANNDPAKINRMTAFLAGGSMTGHFAYAQRSPQVCAGRSQ